MIHTCLSTRIGQREVSHVTLAQRGPAISEVALRHRQQTTRLCLATAQYAAWPQRGHEKPSGHRLWTRYSIHDTSDAKYLRKSLTVVE